MKSKLGNFSIMLRNDAQYPNRLLDAKYPIELFYYKGDLGILNLPSISIVGTRKVSPDGIKRTTKLTRLLCQSGFAIVSGLARGVDTVALETAISLGQKVIGVIGTPIDEYYPIENKSLQNEIIRNHLLISQVPFFKYHNQPFPQRKVYFPERNITMAALSDATVIVEASETSGTLTQARACLQQGRKLFILNSCFDNPNITWPRKYEAKGAIRIRNIEDILIEVNK
jgi:DNA processing protein